MVVVADRAGRLGNKLLLFAHLIAASTDAGFRVVLPEFGEYHRSFPSLNGGFPMYPSRGETTPLLGFWRFLVFHSARLIAAVTTRLRLPGNRWVRAIRLQEGERLDLGDAAVREQLTSTTLMVLQGWLFRDPGSLRNHADEIRRVLSPEPAVLAEAKAAVEEARGEGGIVVGIHLRQGDYRMHLGGRFFFSAETYVATMEQIVRLFSGDVRFLVTTDSEQDWDLFSHLPYRRTNGDVLNDLFALAACDYLCGPPSSFSLWASFFGGTPLAMLVSPEQELTPDDFCVAPDIRDPSVADLY